MSRVSGKRITHGPDHEIASRAATVNARKSERVEHEIIISRPAAELYALWRNFESLPRFMLDLLSVTVKSDRLSHWILRLPAGRQLEWDAEIVNDIPGELIAWKTVAGAAVPHAGSVHFRPLESGATRVRLEMDYEPPGGVVGVFVARLLGQDPDARVEEDLARFKASVERPSS